VFEPPAITAPDQPYRTMAPKSSVITELKTHSARKEFAPDRQRPIMSREDLIMTPNFVPEFKHNGNYALNNSRSTTFHNSSTDRQTNGKHVQSIRVTDKKSACGYNNHCDCSTKPFSSCVNKDAMCKVPFPRSNSIRMINAQFPKTVRKLNYSSGNRAKELEKAQNSTDRTLRQNRIKMHQSASRDSSQSATPLIDQSEPHV